MQITRFGAQVRVSRIEEGLKELLKYETSKMIEPLA